MNSLIIAIGDLHGHYRALERLLDAVQKRYGIFSAGGEDRLRPGVQFVFTGDYIDRGRHALGIMVCNQDTGYIVAPFGASLHEELRARCEQTDRSPEAWVPTFRLAAAPG